MKTRHRAVVLAGVFAAAATGVVSAAGPASADRGPCYNRGDYSFQNDFGDGTWRKIDVYRDSDCPGRAILSGKVDYVASQNQIVLTASDAKCDNIGLTLYTHGWSLASPGCHRAIDRLSKPLGSFGNPKNFWVRVGGTTNSDALHFPI